MIFFFRRASTFDDQLKQELTPATTLTSTAVPELL
jgi:hypothetical protein